MFRSHLDHSSSLGFGLRPPSVVVPSDCLVEPVENANSVADLEAAVSRTDLGAQRCTQRRRTASSTPEFLLEALYLDGEAADLFNEVVDSAVFHATLSSGSD